MFKINVFRPMVVVFLFMLMINQAFAILSIDVNRGVDKPILMAVVPFGDQNTYINAALPNGFSGVIDNDLSHSGRFAILPVRQLPEKPHALADFHPNVWQSKRIAADYVLIGRIDPKDSRHVSVRFELVSVLSNKPLLGQVFPNVAADQLRALAHHISDLAYHAITGQKGYFSTRLAYITVKNQASPNPTYSLYIADQDGFNPQLLLRQVGIPIASPTWSPDGKRLAYVSYNHARMAIYMITLATGKRQRVADFDGINSAPAFSPDGQSLAMALSKGRGAQTSIYLMNLHSKSLTQLTRVGTNTSPSFSVDGRALYIVSDRGGSPQIYKLNINSKHVERISFYGVQNFSPKVLPNGQGLVLMHQAVRGGPMRIGVLDFASSQIRVLTHGALDKAPSVAPNSSMVVYANYDKPKGVLAEAGINANVQLVLPESAGSVQSPAWSPFLT